MVEGPGQLAGEPRHLLVREEVLSTVGAPCPHLEVVTSPVLPAARLPWRLYRQGEEQGEELQGLLGDTTVNLI